MRPVCARSFSMSMARSPSVPSTTGKDTLLPSNSTRAMGLVWGSTASGFMASSLGKGEVLIGGQTIERRGGMNPPRLLAQFLGVGASSTILPRRRPSHRRARDPRRCFRSTSVGPRRKDSRGLDRDKDPFARFGLRDGDRKDTVLEYRIDPVFLDRHRQPDRPREDAVGAFDSVEPLVLLLFLLLPLTGNGEDVILQRYLDVLDLQAGHFHGHEEQILVLGEIENRGPFADPASRQIPIPHTIEEAVHLVTQDRQ